MVGHSNQNHVSRIVGIITQNPGRIWQNMHVLLVPVPLFRGQSKPGKLALQPIPNHSLNVDELKENIVTNKNVGDKMERY